MMNKDPLISILLPVFNAAPFLTECLTTILQQSESKWELLSVDDYSTDAGLSILEDFAAKDSRIAVLKNRNKGIIPALRLAFEQSKGQLITRMDADDRMAPQKLEELKKLLLKRRRGHISTGQVKYFSSQELGEGYRKYEGWLNRLSKEGRNFEEIYKECVIPSPCWMLYREDLIRCNAFEPDVYPEDYDLCFRFYKNGLKVIGSGKTLHFWRDHACRTSRTHDHYANQRYFELKLPYFLELDYEQERPLVLWGAGKKGKCLAEMLHKRGISFHWVCNNPAKYGKKLYGATFQSYQLVAKLPRPQVIVAVAAPGGQEEILVFLKKCNLRAAEDFFFFC